MNPLVIIGILAITISSVALMLSFSQDQIEYSQTTERVSSIQAQRLQEKITISSDLSSLESDSHQLTIKNVGTIPIEIKEIRIINDTTGDVVTQYKISKRILASQSDTLDVDHSDYFITSISDAVPVTREGGGGGGSDSR